MEGNRQQAQPAVSRGSPIQRRRRWHIHRATSLWDMDFLDFTDVLWCLIWMIMNQSFTQGFFVGAKPGLAERVRLRLCINQTYSIITTGQWAEVRACDYMRLSCMMAICWFYLSSCELQDHIVVHHGGSKWWYNVPSKFICLSGVNDKG